jgi:hypothetical protein
MSAHFFNPLRPLNHRRIAMLNVDLDLRQSIQTDASGNVIPWMTPMRKLIVSMLAWSA